MFDDVEVELRAVEDVLPWSKKREILAFVREEKSGIDAAWGKLTLNLSMRRTGGFRRRMQPVEQRESLKQGIFCSKG